MQWYMLAFISAILLTIATIARKEALQKSHAMEVTTWRAIIGFTVSLFLLPRVDFNISGYTIILIFLGALIGAFGLLYLSKAYKHGSISEIDPLLNLSPLVLLVISYFVLGETWTTWQMGGIGLIVLGAYALEANNHPKHLITPLKKLFTEKYNRYVLLVVVLFSITATIDKVVLNSTDFATFMFFVWMFMSVIFIVAHSVMYDGIVGLKKCIKRTPVWIVIMGLFSTISLLFYYQAVSLAFVSLVIPLRRLSTLLTTLIGGEVFHEKHLLHKAIACVIMLVGVYFIIA